MIKYVPDENEKEKIAKEILSDLKEWFDEGKMIDKIAADCRDLPFWARCTEDNKNQGFIALRETGKRTCEIACVGVRKEFRNQGFGKEMWEFFKHYATDKGYSFAQVKSVADGEDKNFDETNAFFRSIGFEEFEIMPDIRTDKKPCQIFISSIDSGLFDFF